MLFEKNAAWQLSEELFRNPTAEYRAIPFWSWNCRVSKELIEKELLIFKEMGFGGVDIHPRSGLDTEYLGDEYMDLIAYTVEKCREIGLACWLYDDDRFPSGSAGGIITQDYRLRGRFLLLTEQPRSAAEGFYADQESFEAAIDAGEKPAGYYAAAYALELENGYLRSYRRLGLQEEAIRRQQEGQKIRFAYVKMMPEEAWFEDQAYADTMNPDAVEAFIRATHEAYYQKVGEEFGRTVPAIFTDEPRMGKHAQLSAAMSGEDVTIPYTDHLAQTMRERFALDPLDIVPEYIWEREDGYSRNRYRYREAAAECFVSTFMDRIGRWCAEHGIIMTGHVLAEDTLDTQVFALGDCMRCYRQMDLPGIDILSDRKEFAAVKQVVSVARQNGREGTISELYGVTHWDCDFKTFKLQGDWQAALGINVRIPHLSHMSLLGEAKRDWPGSIFFHAPWYREWPYLEDHFARLNTVLTRGQAIVNIGVLHPVESMWMCMGPNDQTGDRRREMDEDFAGMIRWLLYGLLDFDFISEALLPEQAAGASAAEPGRLAVGKMSYSAILIPGMLTIRSTTLDILEAFCAGGGRVIFMGRIPELVDGEKSERAQRLASQCLCIRRERAQLYAALEPVREVEIRTASGFRSDRLFYQLRQDNSCKWLFISHVEHRYEHMSDAEQYTIKVKGCYAVKRYDTQSGRSYAVNARTDGADTWIECALYAEDSVLYQLRAGSDADSRPCEPAVRYETAVTLTQADGYSRQERNAVLLDYAQYRLDDGPLQGREEILRLDNQIRRQLGFVIREDRMNQPYHLQEKEHHTVTLYYHLQSQISAPAFLAIEEPEHCRIWLNGEEADRTVVDSYVDFSIAVIALPDLRMGENELKVQVDYHQKTNLENLFVLGDFDVELRGTRPLVTARSGQLSIGDITAQGMPFYTGSLEYRFRFSVSEEGEYAVHVPHFKAPLLAASADGGEEKLIAYAPHRALLGKLKKGEHELTLRVYGNRFNGFGTLHNANDNFVWYGPDSYRTTGDDWTDSYRLRPVGLMSAVEIERVIV